MKWSQWLQNLKYLTKCDLHVEDFLQFERMLRHWGLSGQRSWLSSPLIARLIQVVCVNVHVQICVCKQGDAKHGRALQGPQLLATISSPRCHIDSFHDHSGRNNKELMCGCVVYVHSGGQDGPGQTVSMCHVCDSLSDTAGEALAGLLFLRFLRFPWFDLAGGRHGGLILLEHSQKYTVDHFCSQLFIKSDDSSVCLLPIHLKKKQEQQKKRKKKVLDIKEWDQSDYWRQPSN